MVKIALLEEQGTVATLMDGRLMLQLFITWRRGGDLLLALDSTHDMENGGTGMTKFSFMDNFHSHSALEGHLKSP